LIFSIDLNTLRAMSSKKDPPAKWFYDYLSDNERHLYAIGKVIESRQTAHQKVEILELKEFGRSLVLDDDLQSTEFDEFIYHEAIIHPSMTAHPNPKHVLLLGGGEGYSAREILKYKSVDSVVMVDIDEEVVNLCRRHFSKQNANIFEEARLKLVFADAMEFVKSCRQKFDVIVSDLSSPFEGGPSCELYTVDFYQRIRDILNPGGIICVQGDAFNNLRLDTCASIYKTLQKVFKIVRVAVSYIPSFITNWSFITASDTVEPWSFKSDEVDRLIKSKKITSLFYYDGETHERIFRIPKHLRKSLEERGHVIETDNLVSVYQ
jgi:spermidine synthase